MKTVTQSALFFAVICSFMIALTQGQAQTSAFTYQGRLNDGANLANGSYDLTFALFDAASGGDQVGGILTSAATAVSSGIFTVTLDFGAGAFPGADRWLVRQMQASQGEK